MGDDEMQKCEKCKVSLKGNYSVCPLCGGIIQKEETENVNEFPGIPTIYQEFNYFIRLMTLISIVAIVISFAVNLIFMKESTWSLLVAAGIVCMWLSLFLIIRKKSNIPKTILWQVVLLGVLSVVWDVSMGWRGWSIDYVIPSIIVIAIISMAIGAKLLKIGVRDLLIYMLIDAIFGFIPILFIVFGWLNVLFPSVICVASCVISVSALILFEGDNMKSELNKRMHI
jgi:hypothetical protein